MPIVRRETSDPFFSCSRALAQNESLSFAAVGLMAYLLSKPGTWEVQFADVERRGKFGRDTRQRLFAELETAGYLERRRERQDDGTWDYVLIVHEQALPDHQRTTISKPARAAKSNKTPLPEKPSTVEPSTALPSTAQPSTVTQAVLDNKEVQKTEKENKEGQKAQAQSLATHPAIQFIRSLLNTYPPKSLWPEIIELTGENPDTNRLTLCFNSWIKRGWNKMNFVWLFDWYAQGQIPGTSQGNQIATLKSNGNGMIVDPAKLSPKTRGNAQALEDFISERRANNHA